MEKSSLDVTLTHCLRIVDKLPIKGLWLEYPTGHRLLWAFKARNFYVLNWRWYGKEYYLGIAVSVEKYITTLLPVKWSPVQCWNMNVVLVDWWMIPWFRVVNWTMAILWPPLFARPPPYAAAAFHTRTLHRLLVSKSYEFMHKFHLQLRIRICECSSGPLLQKKCIRLFCKYYIRVFYRRTRIW